MFVKGPTFTVTVNDLILRDNVVKDVREIITPTETGSSYTLIIGEDGTGKTSLIELAVGSMEQPKGVVYVDILPTCFSEEDVISRIQQSLIRSYDPLIDHIKRNYSGSF